MEAKTKAQLILDRNLATHTYFSHTLKPKVIDKNFKSLNNEEYYYKECSINARSPENEAD